MTITAPPAPVPSWLPHGSDARQLPAGVWWDAVTVPAYLGDRVLDQLADADCGAVVRDPIAHRLTWLVPVGGAAGAAWDFVPNALVRILGAGCHLMVPPAGRTRSPSYYWARPVIPGRAARTDPAALHAVLAAVVAEEFGPRPGEEAR